MSRRVALNRVGACCQEVVQRGADPGERRSVTEYGPAAAGHPGGVGVVDRGRDAGQFDGPSHNQVAVASSTMQLFVVDVWNDRVQVFQHRRLSPGSFVDSPNLPFRYHGAANEWAYGCRPRRPRRRRFHPPPAPSRARPRNPYTPHTASTSLTAPSGLTVPRLTRAPPVPRDPHSDLLLPRWSQWSHVPPGRKR